MTCCFAKIKRYHYLPGYQRCIQAGNDSRNVRLAFTYSFGNQKLKAARNRSTGSDAEANRVKTN
jgi:hypothetical protein